MSRKLAFVAIAFLLASAPTLAQINPFGNNPQRFADADRQLMYGAMIEVLESQEVGTTADWASTDGSFGGVAELTEVYSQDGMRCGELRHVFEDLVDGDAVRPDVSRIDVRGCEVPGEGWKFAF